MSYTTYLAHHGIKGQKWGVRRYQNEDGSLTSAGIKRVQASIKRLRKKSKKYNRKAKIVSKIVSTLSDDEYMLLNPGIPKKAISSLGRDYFNKSAGEANSYTAKRIIIRDKKLQPVSYLDAHLVPRYGEKPTLNISVATANNNGTRGKGYANKAVKKMLKWHAKNKKIFGDIEWDVAPNNVASRRLAEKNGFEYAYTDNYNGWIRYIHHSALSHHGIKGQKWGIRRTPEQLGHVNGGTPKIYKLHNYKGKLYFISKEEMDGKTLNPRVPDNFLTRNGFEDGTTKRVCFSHDPGKCLTAMSQNVSGQSFNVYEPAEKHDVYKPNNVVVPDADITGEMWIKEPVKLKKVGTIKCTGDTGEAGLPYKYGNNTAELYDWNYEWTASKEVSHSVIVNDDIYPYRSYLAHHGIKGQKWGVRRFQNYDGTRIKSEKVPIPKGPYFKKVGILNRSSNFWDNHKETQAAKELRKIVSSVSSEVIAKNNADESRVNSFREWAIANQAQYWSKGFGDERDEYVKLYHEYTERVDQHNFNSDVNEIRSKLNIPSNAGAVVYKIIDSAIEQEYDKAIYTPALDNDEYRKKRNVFDDLYHDTSITSDSPEVQSAYADILRKGKSIYDKEYKLLNLVEIAAKTPLTTEENQNYQKLIKDLGYDYVECDPIFDPIATIADVKKELKEVSHSVIVNDDIYSYRSYLAHHGIKGQKWGVRRFQKANGSLTAAGAKRYGIKGAMSAGRKVGAGLVKAARGGIQKAKEVKARKAAEKLERQKKVWAKTRLGLTMNADKFTVEELREANNRLDERDRAARGLAAQVERGVGYFKAIRDVTGAIKDTKDYIEDISGEKGKKAKAADELKYQRDLEKEQRTYERDMVRDKVKADQEYEYKREKDRLDRESKEKIEKMKAKAKKKKDSGGSDSDPEPDEAPKKKSSRENTTEFEDVYWNSSKKDREFMETVFPKEVDETKERKKRRNKARREVDEAIRRMGFFGHSDISTYGAYLEHHGIKGQKWGVRRFQNYDGTRINKNHTSNAADAKQAAKMLKSTYKKYMRAEEEWDDDGMDKAISQLGRDKSFQRSVKPVVDIVNSTYKKHKDVFDEPRDTKSEKMQNYLHDLQKIDDCVKNTAKKLGIKDTTSDSYEYNFFANALAGYIDSMDKDEHRRFLQSDWIVHGVIEHHGIKGQKWGIRRFQNEDGTRIIKKGTRFKRTSIHEDDPTFDNKKYVSTNNRDARKWRDYLGNAYAQRGHIVYEHEYKTTKDIAVARGKDICAVINEEFKKNPKKWKQLNADTDRAMKMLNYVKDNMSDDDRYSTNFAAQTNSGKEIMRALQKRGYDAVEDLHGRNVSDDPIIVFNPDENLKHKKVKQHWEYYYRNMYG